LKIAGTAHLIVHRSDQFKPLEHPIGRHINYFQK